MHRITLNVSRLGVLPCCCTCSCGLALSRPSLGGYCGATSYANEQGTHRGDGVETKEDECKTSKIMSKQKGGVDKKREGWG